MVIITQFYHLAHTNVFPHDTYTHPNHKHATPRVNYCFITQHAKEYATDQLAAERSTASFST
jgi:hypothetical protein